MGRRCCIQGCNSTSRLAEHHGVTYHSFPLDANIRTVWIRNTRLSSERQITKSVLVCSRHFRRADFQPQRSGKYLLKQRVFPTVFPWGKVDPTLVEADLVELKASGGTATSNSEDTTKATVEAKIAQIMAETAELNAAAGGIKIEPTTSLEGGEGTEAALSATQPVTTKFEPVTSFNPGVRLEAQDFDGAWHSARVVEVDNDDREVLIKFERSGKMKSAVVGTEEWIPMNSTRLRQKVSNKPIPVFELDEKCMARWSGPRKFPGTVKKILDNDSYEILFDDGYVKNVRAIHMNKAVRLEVEATAVEAASPDTPVEAPVTAAPKQASTDVLPATPPPAKASKGDSPSFGGGSSTVKKRAPPGPRKDWPLLDMSKLDLAALNLPEIPHDGEWTCHWVNDQPIGLEGFLIVGEHRKPTVIVDDWRLPTDWVKHMYQRSNVLGKWDVILVTPNGKRFRSKSDLKTFLEDQGQVYNPDIYDFSIHRRRAKDINAYAFTADYTPQQAPKAKLVDNTLDTSNEMDPAAVLASSLAATSASQYIETPVATAVPPMELMTPPVDVKKNQSLEGAGQPLDESVNTLAVAPTTTTVDGVPIGNGFAYIGGLKVEIIDNLFRCPQANCSKNFRKENHLQIHIKHYHQDLIKLLGVCPKMLDLAEKRTHTIKPDQHGPLPKNQIPNQQFFAKLHQQDLEQTRAHRRSIGATGTPTIATELEVKIKTEGNQEIEGGTEILEASTVKTDEKSLKNNAAANNSQLDQSLAPTPTNANESATNTPDFLPTKRARFTPSKRTTGSRKSNRQRTTRRYLTAAQATIATPNTLTPVATVDSSFGVSDFEETRSSFNATPDAKLLLSDAKKRKSSAAPATPLSSIDSPVTADSCSSSYLPLKAPSSSNEADNCGAVSLSAAQSQYIKENGEIIKIVRMRQEEIINCLCSYGEEDGLMIQCELCLCWQHGICNGINTESEVPEKYVCYICRNPQRGRESMRFKHDQDWLYEGKLPVANYHIANPVLPKRFEFLKKSHTLTGNLIELKRFMHSLRVKINIADNRCHPKLYLWAKKWDEEMLSKCDVKREKDFKCKLEMDTIGGEAKMGDANGEDIDIMSTASSPSKKLKSEVGAAARYMPNIPQPEAPIDPVECQQRLLEHIKVQQNLVMNRLTEIETEIDRLEKHDELPDLNDADQSTSKDIVATFIKELDIMKQIGKLNALESSKSSVTNPIVVK